MPLFSRHRPQFLTRRIGFVNLPLIRRWLARWQMSKLFPLFFLKRHGYVVARTGSGKSELLKLLLISLKQKLWRFPWNSGICRQTTVFLLDPHGDLAEECARLRCFANDFFRSERKKQAPNLVYISPTLSKPVFPTLNPFEVPKRFATTERVHLLAQFLSRAFASMIGQKQEDLSLNMKTLLLPMVSVLLFRSLQEPERPMTFHDLARFLRNESNSDLVEFGKHRLPDGEQRSFFAHSFFDPQYAPTKFALMTRLMSLLLHPQFNRLLNRPHSSWRVEDLFHSGKTVIINASKSVLGQEVSEIFGRTVTAFLQASAFLSAGQNWGKSTFYLLDESSTFLCDDIHTILAEQRKFGLHLILANQMVRPGNMSLALFESVMSNTAVKIIGSAGYASRKVFSLECDLPKEVFGSLRIGQFVVSVAGNIPQHITFPKFWLGKMYRTSETKWAVIRRYLLRRWYPRKPPKTKESQPPSFSVKNHVPGTPDFGDSFPDWQQPE